MSYPTAPDLTGCTTAIILPLADPAISATGHDPRSYYAETFWLPILGPSTLWLLRHTAQRFEHEPEGFELEISEVSAALGIRSNGGRSNAFQRAMNRLVGFNMGRSIDDRTIEVRRIMPNLHSGQIRRLSPRLQRMHIDELTSRELNRVEDKRRATEVATTLLRLGDSPDLVEQQLVSWGVEPHVAHQSVNEAWAQKARDDAANSQTIPPDGMVTMA